MDNSLNVSRVQIVTPEFVGASQPQILSIIFFLEKRGGGMRLHMPPSNPPLALTIRECCNRLISSS